MRMRLVFSQLLLTLEARYTDYTDPLQSLDSRPAWRGIQLRNKVGISVSVPELQVQ